MLRLLQSDTEMVIDSGFIYLPLMFDPAIDEEVKIRGTQPGMLKRETAKLIQVHGKYFLQSLRISSILDNYRKLDPETFEYLRRSVIGRFLETLNPASFSVDEELKSIIFQVIPHFARKKNRLQKRQGAEKELMELINRQVAIPDRYYSEAVRFADTLSLRTEIRNIGAAKPSAGTSPSGLTTGRAFRRWLMEALESRVIEEEENRLENLLQSRLQFAKLQKEYIAVLLFAQETGAMELNGSGFFRKKDTGEYYVYARTGQYALKDYYDRIYLFADCRVGVSTFGPMVPYVVEKYKHPFLLGYEPFQKICVRGDFTPDWEFSAAGAIQAIEEGISALFHGYNNRRGNGHHRLDAMWMENNSIVFDDLRIPRDDPRIVSGQIEIKNDFY